MCAFLAYMQKKLYLCSDFMLTTMRKANLLFLIMATIIAFSVETISAAELPEGALPGVFNVGDIDKTDGIAQAAALADKF